MKADTGKNVHDKWYFGHPLVWILAPLSLLFFLISAMRRALYNVGVKKVYRPSCPVIVVGNISVGGNGKTPVVLALADHYREKGVKVGILSRGYGAKSPFYPRKVKGDDNASEVGDEPRLLAIRSDCDVVIDPNRSRGARFLVEQCNCELIICDDGLQHYALARDVELVVMDDRKVGSGFLLPMGPLREGTWRLSNVDAIVHNARTLPTFDNPVAPQFLMSLTPGKFVNVQDTSVELDAEQIAEKTCHAVAGIGSPQRFFNQLIALKISLSGTKALPDHHTFTASDIPNGRVIMTEKDAVKVRAFAHHDCWYLPVTAEIPREFYNLLDGKLAKTSFSEI